MKRTCTLNAYVCVHEDGLTCSPSCFDCCVRDEQTHGSRVRTCVVCEPTHPPLYLAKRSALLGGHKTLFNSFFKGRGQKWCSGGLQSSLELFSQIQPQKRGCGHPWPKAVQIRLYRNMPGIVPILRGPINTQYIPILAGLAEWQSSNLFQYLQKSCSRIANIPFGGSTRPVICRSGRAKSLIDPIEPPTIAQECCAITQVRRNVRLERFSEPPT